MPTKCEWTSRTRSSPNTCSRLLNTGTEEIGHIEMLATAVALNLEGAPAKLMAVLEEQKDMGLPVPPDFPQESEAQEFAYDFFVHSDGEVPNLAPAEARPELLSVAIPANGGLLRKAKDAVTP